MTYEQLKQKLENIRIARISVGNNFTHHESCEHRYCKNPEECEDGHEDNDKICMKPGVKCHCGVASLRELLAIIDGGR